MAKVSITSGESVGEQSSIDKDSSVGVPPPAAGPELPPTEAQQIDNIIEEYGVYGILANLSEYLDKPYFKQLLITLAENESGGIITALDDLEEVAFKDEILATAVRNASAYDLATNYKKYRHLEHAAEIRQSALKTLQATEPQIILAIPELTSDLDNFEQIITDTFNKISPNLQGAFLFGTSEYSKFSNFNELREQALSSCAEHRPEKLLEISAYLQREDPKGFKLMVGDKGYDQALEAAARKCQENDPVSAVRFAAVYKDKGYFEEIFNNSLPNAVKEDPETVLGAFTGEFSKRSDAKEVVTQAAEALLVKDPLKLISLSTSLDVLPDSEKFRLLDVAVDSIASKDPHKLVDDQWEYMGLPETDRVRILERSLQVLAKSDPESVLKLNQYSLEGLTTEQKDNVTLQAAQLLAAKDPQKLIEEFAYNLKDISGGSEVVAAAAMQLIKDGNAEIVLVNRFKLDGLDAKQQTEIIIAVCEAAKATGKGEAALNGFSHLSSLSQESQNALTDLALEQVGNGNAETIFKSSYLLKNLSPEAQDKILIAAADKLIADGKSEEVLSGLRWGSSLSENATNVIFEKTTTALIKEGKAEEVKYAVSRYTNETSENALTTLSKVNINEAVREKALIAACADLIERNDLGSIKFGLRELPAFSEEAQKRIVSSISDKLISNGQVDTLVNFIGSQTNISEEFRTQILSKAIAEGINSGQSQKVIAAVKYSYNLTEEQIDRFMTEIATRLIASGESDKVLSNKELLATLPKEDQEKFIADNLRSALDKDPTIIFKNPDFIAALSEQERKEIADHAIRNAANDKPYFLLTNPKILESLSEAEKQKWTRRAAFELAEREPEKFLSLSDEQVKRIPMENREYLVSFAAKDVLKNNPDKLLNFVQLLDDNLSKDTFKNLLTAATTASLLNNPEAIVRNASDMLRRGVDILPETQTAITKLSESNPEQVFRHCHLLSKIGDEEFSKKTIATAMSRLTEEQLKKYTGLTTIGNPPTQAEIDQANATMTTVSTFVQDTPIPQPGKLYDDPAMASVLAIKPEWVNAVVIGLSEQDARLIVGRNLFFLGEDITEKTVKEELERVSQNMDRCRELPLFKDRRVVIAAGNEFNEKNNNFRFVTDSTLAEISRQADCVDFYRGRKGEEQVQDVKAAFLESIRNAPPGTTFYFDGHGYGSGFYLSENTNVSPRELADAFSARTANYPELKDPEVAVGDILIFNCCYNQNLLRNLNSEFHTLGLQLPISIGESEYGQYGYTALDDEYGGGFTRTILGIGDLNSYSTFDSIFRNQYNSEDANPSVFFPSSNGHGMQIAKASIAEHQNAQTA